MVPAHSAAPTSGRADDYLWHVFSFFRKLCGLLVASASIRFCQMIHSVFFDFSISVWSFYRLVGLYAVGVFSDFHIKLICLANKLISYINFVLPDNVMLMHQINYNLVK
jgi:hypothetical protein